MDKNNFENGFTSPQPEKPFTDKTNPNAPISENFGQQATESDTQVQQSIPTPEVKQNFQPQQNPVWQNNNQGYPQQNNGFNPNFPPNPNYYNQPQAHQNDYSQPVYRNTSMPPQNQAYRPNPTAPQNNFGRPPYGQPAPPYPQYGAPVTYAPPIPPVPKKKTSAGLIAIIVVLSVLLVFSIIGIVIYASSGNSSDKKGNKSNNYSYTIPNYGYNYPDEETTTAPEVNHEDTDYSDQIDADYKGIELKSKPKDSSDKSKYTSESVFDNVSDSVVGVVCYTGEITSVEDCDSQGSGIIITSDGYVVTNAHVVGYSKTAYKIQVVTADGKTYNAGVVGCDTRTDIAVLKMDNAKDLQPATFGNSDEIELGEEIIAVGNPGGLDYQNSMTKGIVSAVDRELSSSSLVKYIQTDAAINPGNSGGPIVNIYGQVIGIATAKIVSEQYEGMGFAIPTATAKDIIDSLIRNGYVEGRVKIGITGYEITSDVSQYYNVPQGVCVNEITEGGPCDGTDLQENDIITGLDGEDVTSFSDIYEILGKHKDGDKVEIEFYRESDGNTYKDKITLQADQ